MKLQINSLEALERLIGGETDTELEIRNNIVQEFTKKHLKALTDTDLMRRSISDITMAIEKEVTNSFGEYKGNWNKELQLKPEIKKLILDNIEYWVQQTLHTEIRAEIEKIVDLNKRVDEAATAKIDYINSRYFEDKVNSEVERRLKEIKSKL